MRTTALAIVLVLLAAPAARGASPDDKPASLGLTAELVGRRYCAGNRLHILQLTIRLRYRNAGGQKLILYRGKNLFYQTRIRGNTGGASGRTYEVVVLNSRYNDAQPEAVNSRRPGGAFVTLQPGGTYETQIVVGVGVAPDGLDRGTNSIVPGEHTLHVITSTWYESKKLGEELRDRWRGAGLLWVDPVVTPPLKFTAEGDAPATACR